MAPILKPEGYAGAEERGLRRDCSLFGVFNGFVWNQLLRKFERGLPQATCLSAEIR